MSDSAGREVAKSEREVPLYFLTRARDAVVRVSAGLTAEQQRTPGVPSGTSPLGLTRHRTGAEEPWFQRVFPGQDHDIDLSMTAPPGATSGQVAAACRRARARSDEIVRPAPICPPSPPSPIPASPPVSLRRIVTHMIEETARHADHADILREQIDGATGLCNDPPRAARRNSSAHSLTHRRQRRPARDKPNPPYARSAERALPASSVAITIFPPVNVV